MTAHTGFQILTMVGIFATAIGKHLAPYQLYEEYKRHFSNI